MNSSFSAFIHFPKKRTLSGWALLFAMGKVTSDDFLYGREHVRVWKCRKTRTKVRSKSGQKWVSRVQSRWVQNDEMSIYRQIVSPAGPKKESKIELKNTTKLMVKSTCKIAFGTTGTRSHFRKAGISLNSIWRPIFKNPQKRGPIPKKPNETGNFRGNGQPKKNHENWGPKQH
jgi:hypothetical protein